MSEWIHSRRGADFVDRTVPALVRAIKDLTEVLKKGVAQPHPYVGLRAKIIPSSTSEAEEGMVVMAEEDGVILLLDDGTHRQVHISKIAMDPVIAAAALNKERGN
jgi:hypothetical protein